MEDNELNSGRVESVDMNEIYQITLPDEIDNFFEERKDDDQFNKLKKFSPDEDEFYDVFSATYDKLIKENPVSSLAEVMAGALDFVDFVKNNDPKPLYCDNRDFGIIEECLRQANVEFKAGELDDEDIKNTSFMIGNYIRVITMSSGVVSNIDNFDDIYAFIEEIIKTGNMEILNQLKYI